MRSVDSFTLLLVAGLLPAQTARPSESVPPTPAQRAARCARELELPEKRRAAIGELLPLGPAAIDALLMQARHPDLAIAHVALQTLAELSHDALPAVPKLQQLAAGKDAHARAAAWALARLPHRGTFLVPSMEEGVVRELDADGKEIWKSGNVGKPWSATRLADDHLLVADIGGGACEYDAAGAKVWESNGKRVYTAERLVDGNTLCTDYGRQMVVEVDARGDEVWSYQVQALFAHRLPHGTTFSGNFNNGSLFELAGNGDVLWKIDGKPNTYAAQLLPDGRVLSQSQNGREAEVRDRSGKQLRTVPTLDNCTGILLLPDGSIQCGQKWVRRCNADGSERWKVAIAGWVGHVTLR